MPFPAIFNLSSLDGTNGFRISAIPFGGLSTTGWSVASAGDINGDGFDDLTGGAPYFNNGLSAPPGVSYVVLGSSSAFPARFDLYSLDGSNGFLVGGAPAGYQSGFSVASAGDINGDGFDDLIIGAPATPSYGNGASYVVFGASSGFSGSIDFSGLNGTNGFKISGATAGYGIGLSVASAGDVNGDGFDDMIIGAPGAGASYVVFGASSTFSAEVDLSSLDGSNGFEISGSAGAYQAGFSVASAGDVNGDGFDDVIIGAPNASPNGTNSGLSYVVFGTASGFGADFDLSTLDGSNGFEISGSTGGYEAGRSVASAGDVNGDGLDDVIVGAPSASPNGAYSGASYVVFGTDSGFGANVDLGSLDGTNGFKISGAPANSVCGVSVASAGDINGDGFDDVIIGAPGTNTRTGTSYVVFGTDSAFSADFDLSALDGSNGFEISGVATYDASGFSVASAGDANGDGLDDLVIGAPYAPGNYAEGASYVIFGVKPDSAVERVGTVADQSLVGGDFDDALKGRGGDDELWGHGGKDELKGGDGDDMIFGGSAKDDIDGSKGSDIIFGGSGKDELSGEGGDDTFVFADLGKKNADKIKDFKPSSDMIGLDQGVFNMIIDTLDKSRFEKGKKADDDDDLIIYDKGSGKLFYDVDGKGGEEQVIFAKVEKGLKLTHNDFDVDMFA